MLAVKNSRKRTPTFGPGRQDYCGHTLPAPPEAAGSLMPN
jgi:hypothetical protein